MYIPKTAYDRLTPLDKHKLAVGLENAPEALVGLLAGRNRGKRMVRVSADPA